jgi:hypothetical protein
MGRGQRKPSRRKELEARAGRLRTSLEAIGRELIDLPPDPAAIDMTDASCETCGRGIYVERSPEDGEELLHCSACFADVTRFRRPRLRE